MEVSGGAERVLLNVAGGLAQHGHEVTLATFDGEGSHPFYAVPSGVDLIHLGVGDSRQETRAGEFVRRCRALARLRSRLRPQVGVGFMHSAYVALAFAFAASRTPVFGSEHIVFEHYRERPRQRLALHVAAPLITAMTAVSEPMKATFPWWLRRKMIVIPNPVAEARAQADVSGGSTKSILSVGRLDSQKDQATLIAAFARITGQFPDWRLRIIGEGPLRLDLEKQVTALGLRQVVALPGAVRDIGQEYEAAQLFVFPSRYESFGLATAEAMSHGLPVIGFADCPGTNDLIEDAVNGLLVPPGDRVEGLAKAMASLMDSADLRFRLSAAAAASASRLSIADVAIAWERLLEGVVECRSSNQLKGDPAD